MLANGRLARGSQQIHCQYTPLAPPIRDEWRAVSGFKMELQYLRDPLVRFEIADADTMFKINPLRPKLIPVGSSAAPSPDLARGSQSLAKACLGFFTSQRALVIAYSRLGPFSRDYFQWTFTILSAVLPSASPMYSQAVYSRLRPSAAAGRRYPVDSPGDGRQGNGARSQPGK